MKTDIHPKYSEITFQCSCGASMETRSTLGKNQHIEVCSECHPFFCGKQKMMDTAGRIEKFNRRYRKAS